METSLSKVFSSNITRAEAKRKNNLYDLLNIVPAKPLTLNDIKKYTCDFNPKTDKYYIPKRKSRLKVKTVRDIRKSFEQDTYDYLISDLETQENILLKKIRRGSSRDNNTKQLAKNLLHGDTPISRSTWQMLINLNPEQHTYPRQFVLWNGKYIQVNGSVGGKKELLSNFDLATTKILQSIKKKKIKQNVVNRNKGLLRNSLAVKFKPGPLGRKKFLDDSHQKYHVGTIEVIDLPKIGLDIHPTYGVALEPKITNFLNNMRKEDGTISQKWAELAVSVLGRLEKSAAVQLDKVCVSFDLKYNYNQNRIVMRRDVDSWYNTPKLIKTSTISTNKITDEVIVLPEIKDILNKIIESVEINITQDTMYIQEDEMREPSLDDLHSEDMTNVKDKIKRRFCELDKLDVTVIRLPETEERNLINSCPKKHCALGCICKSLEGTFSLRQHCGRIECMFDCKCNFSKYKNLVCSELIPGLLNLDNERNLKLAKEEQKFHQTVIVTGEKSILLKAEKRNWKTPKKYADFYSNMNLKNNNHENKVLSIVALKLNCENIEPWCMVHKLYKCFCKGKFTETCISVSNENGVKEPFSKDTTSNIECSLDKNITDSDIVQDITMRPCPEQKKSKISKNPELNNMLANVSKSFNGDPEKKLKAKDTETKFKTIAELKMNHINGPKIMTRNASKKLNKIIIDVTQKSENYETNSGSESGDTSDLYLNDKELTCARTNAYEGRKFSDGYYKNTNYKILEMEKNDKRLQERLAILNNNSPKEKTLKGKEMNPSCLLQLINEGNEFCQPSKSNSDDDDMAPKSERTRLSSESKLVAWLESNYKLYKRQNSQGLIKNSLEPPKLGKVALHSWNFILSRYRERKNLFLISPQKPFRIFMAVHTRNPFFEHCININDIRFADLHKYPQTVKNLLTNATDLKDNFCILRGLSCCWELIGSVTKVNEGNDNVSEINIESSDMPLPQSAAFVLNSQNDTNDTIDSNSSEDNTDQKCIKALYFTQKDLDCHLKTVEDPGSSKWFVMTIEDDFSEVRFFRRGFFVKHESIVNAINVARATGKTVRLSSKKCIEQCDIPQFGIYAIPNANEYCVFVGPYEMEDTLGIETIKTILDVRKTKRTRGFWITTNKIDNLKVVENPLSFMPLTNPENSDVLPLDNNVTAMDDIDKTPPEAPGSSNSNQIENVSKVSAPIKGKKIVKPIKIRKTNGYYHLASKKMALQYPQTITNSTPVILNPSFIVADDNSLLKLNIPVTPNEEIADATSQIKISAVFSTQNEESQAKSVKHDRGMFILKPEEINRKLIENKIISKENEEIQHENLMALDMNSYPTTSIESSVNTENEIFIISDDAASESSDNDWTEVWIECTNSDLGWIMGRCDSYNLLSYKFPGSEFSEFYTQEEAFAKINLEIYKRLNSSTDLKLQWKVTESADQVKGKEINPDYLYPDFILTKGGLVHMSDIIKSNKSNLKTYSRNQRKDKNLASCLPSQIDSSSKIEFLEEMEEV